MPPQQRARKTATAPAASAQGLAEPAAGQDQATETPPLAEPEQSLQPGQGPICGECFPGGWNALPEDAPSAGCEHGTYTR